MALVFRTIYKNCIHYKLTKPVRWNFNSNYPLRIASSGICYRVPPLKQKDREYIRPLYSVQSTHNSTKSANENPDEPEQKLGLVQKFKQMYKNYWYVLVPVHMVTSAVWFGGFYYTVRSGVDVISLLQSMGISEKIIEPLRDSGAGYFALAFACYKIATPLRYAVTLGGTTYAIKKLTAFGLIKPVPSRERLKEMFQEKKENIQDRFQESKQHYQLQIKEKRTQVMDEMKRYKSEIQEAKKKDKKM